MNSRQSRQVDTLHSAKAFMVQNALRMPSVAASGTKQDLDDAITNLEAHSESQASRILIALGTTQRVMSLRAVLLRDHMAHVAGIARAKLPATPELMPLRLPQRRLSDRNLASAADAMAAAATPFAQVFVDAGLPQDFIARLSGAADALLASRELLKQTQGQRSGATEGLDDMLRHGRRTLKALDSFVVSALKDDPALLANWKMLIRVRKATGPRAVSAGAAGGAVVQSAA